MSTSAQPKDQSRRAHRPAVFRSIWAIGRNTFREAIRNRVLHAILAVSVGLVISSLAIGELSLENNARVIRDIGMGFINFAVVLVAIFSGVSLLQDELKKKTIYTIVTKPVARWTFICGKYLGLVLTMLTVQASLAAVILIIMLVRGDYIGVIVLQTLLLIAVEGMVVAAIATLFSSFSTPMLSGVLTFGIVVLGRLREDIYSYANASKVEALGSVLEAIGVVVPNLSLLRTDHELAHLIQLNWSFVAWASAYSLLYATATLALSCLIFARRDFV